MTQATGKKYYFASDFHLGAPNQKISFERELRICAWMDHIRPDCAELFLVGDVFDFWFEYKQAIPRGFVRLQGKIAEFTDAGIPVHLFTGNHDMWIFDYLPKELGIQLHREVIVRELHGKRVIIGHGDGLGPGDHKYKLIKRIFASKLCQWLFARLHPNFGIGLASWMSRSSRASTGNSDETYHGEEKEWLVQYCKAELAKGHVDHFIFGHRHLPLRVQMDSNSLYHNLGDWIQYNTFGVLSETDFALFEWKDAKPVLWESTSKR